MTEMGVAIPASLTYAPINFETETLADGLGRAGVDLNAPAIFAWLGVVPYLTCEATMATLGSIAAMPAGSQVIFDYGEPRENLPEPARVIAEELARRVAAAGEPWISFFQPPDLAADVKALGYSRIDDFGQAALNTRYFAGRTDGLAVSATAHVMRATV